VVEIGYFQAFAPVIVDGLEFLLLEVLMAHYFMVPA